MEKRLTELDKLIPSIYEDKALGRIPETVCIQLMKQYEDERREKLDQKAELSAKLEALDRPTLLRLIDRIEIGERRVVDGRDERDIRIFYKFVGLIEV